jgi:hypothetical protein
VYLQQNTALDTKKPHLTIGATFLLGAGNRLFGFVFGIFIIVIERINEVAKE